MKRRDPQTMLGGVDLLEQSVHALRLTSPGTLLCYYVGAAPFVLAILFFWSDMSRSGLAEQHLAGGAIGLSLLFVWMKLWQSIFTLRLSAQVAQEPAPRVTVGLLLRAIASQTLIHATGLFLLPIAINIRLPFAWAFGFYQNVTIFGLREPTLNALVRRSWKQARFAPMQNHTALAALTLFGFFVFLNVGITMLGAPYLIKMFAGIETSFTLSLASSANTTFLAAVTGVTYLCIDPLIKAVYVMRCFYGESRSTGEDLRVMLRSFRKPALALLILSLALGVPWAARAAKVEPPPPVSERATELDRAIDKVLQRPEYTWRAPRPKREVQPQEEWALWKRMKAWLKEAVRSIGEWIGKLFRRMVPPGSGSSLLSARGFVYLLIAAVLAVVGVLLWLLWRLRSRTGSLEVEATPAAPLPDFASDDVAGDELPVDGWTKLALELLERGELRLAMRAFYFSSLAHLAARSLVNIAKFKSNRDYERELLRRSHALPDLTKIFSDNISVFDRVWYGLHEINRDAVQQFRGNVERIRAC